MRRVGQRLSGRYRIEEELGRGASSVVYRVWDERHGEALAAKCLAPGASHGPRPTALFHREYRALRQLSHPCIVEVGEYGVDEEGPFFMMELLEGQDLRGAAPLAVSEACLLLRDVASALALLHARRWLHRDLSPRNVLRTRAGRAKLIDFGALTTEGLSSEVVGTPPFMPPEALSAQMLDARADLFGLGALAYRLLTGRHAYEASRLDELSLAWQREPAPPSAFRDDLPEALDALVMAMLQLDRERRPSRAAEVLEQLGAIAHVPAETAPEVALAYFASPPLVGRARERSALVDCLEQALRGQGGAVLVHGARGTGRSRLLDELSVEASLAGARLLRADAASAPACPYGLLSQWIECTYADVTGESPAEHRARLQTELRAWLRSLGEERPLVIVVDDLDRADETSLAVLAAVAADARKGSVLVAGTILDGAGEQSEMAGLRALWSGSRARIEVGPLRRQETFALSASLFGEVPSAQRVAAWMHRLTEGNPLLCMELARHLLDREVVRCVDACWVLPRRLPRAVPRSLAESAAARVDALDPRTRSVGEVLSVHEKALPEAWCHAVASGTESESIALLDALVRADILVRAGGCYAFRKPGTREALLEAMPEARRRDAHRRLGEAMLADLSVGARQRIEAAFHLMCGGAEREGAALVVAACEHLPSLGGVGEAVVPVLERALVITARDDGSECATRLRVALSYCAYLYDRSLAHYGQAAMRTLAEHVGLSPSPEKTNAPRPSTEPRPSPAQRAMDPLEAIGLLLSTTFSLSGVAVFEWDLPAVQELARAIEPLARLGEHTFPGLAHELLATLVDAMEGRDALARRRRLRVLEALAQPGRIFGMPEEVRHHVRATQVHAAGMAELARGRLHAGLARARALEDSGFRMYEGGALQIRMLAHLYEGESTQAEACREHIELLAIQHGSVAQVETWILRYLTEPLAWAGDASGLRRTADALERLSARHPGYAPDALLARGAHLRARGELRLAHQAFEQAHGLAPCGKHARWFSAVVALTESLVDAEQPAQALSMVGDALSNPSTAGMDRARMHHALAPIVARAEASLGWFDPARRRLSRAIERATHDGAGALWLGRLHETSAQVAILAGDRHMAATHVEAMGRSYGGRGTAVLLARHQSLRSALRGRVSPEHTELCAEPVTALSTQAGACVPGGWA